MSDNSDSISKEVHTEREELHLTKGKKNPMALVASSCSLPLQMNPCFQLHMCTHTHINSTLVGQVCTFTTPAFTADRQVRATSLHKVLTVCNTDKMPDHF